MSDKPSAGAARKVLETSYEQFMKVQQVLSAVIEESEEVQQRCIQLAIQYGMSNRNPHLHNALLYLESLCQECLQMRQDVEELGYSSFGVLKKAIKQKKSKP